MPPLAHTGGHSSAAAVFKANSAQQKQRSHTTTSINRWSVLTKALPPVESINTIHVYDFDNTLFKTPLPNPKLWNGPTIGLLANPDVLNGGWWHDSRILAATGEGILKEEPRGWEGWWNDMVVELVELSMKQKDALCVLLTGRSESGFSDLVQRMVTSRGLEFDMVSLKPSQGPDGQRFPSTMAFKQVILEELMETYRDAQEIRIYEDRIKHVKGFRDFLSEYNVRLNAAANALQHGGPPPRASFLAEVVHVVEPGTNLDPVIEVAEVQHLINAHNAKVTAEPNGRRREKLVIKKTVFYTGYLIKPDDTARLLALAAPQLPRSESELKVHANNIMICPRPCPRSILDKVGGIGAKLRWEVLGTGCLDNSIWAASVRPVPSSSRFHTDNKTPHVVLALRKGVRPYEASRIQNWQPLSADKAFQFETTVGEKILFRVEAEDPSEDEYESLFATKTSKRKHTADDEPPSWPRSGGNGNGNGSHGGNPQSKRYTNDQGSARGGGRGGRGGPNFRGNPTRGRGNGRGSNGFRGGGGRGGGGGGRGGKHGYHSLDDPGKRSDSGSQSMSYEDSGYATPPQPQQYSQPPQAQYPVPPPPPLLMPGMAYYPQAPPGGPVWQPPTGPASGGGGYSGEPQNYY